MFNYKFTNLAAKTEYTSTLHILHNSLSKTKMEKLTNEVESFEQMLEQISEVPKDELFLGFETPDFEDVVTIKIPKTSRCSLTISQKGDGKSYLMWHIINDEWQRKTGWYVLRIDPQQEYLWSDRPVNTGKELKLLEKAGKKPIAPKIFFCSPEFAQLPYTRGKQARIGLNNIKNLLNTSEQVAVLADLLNISENDASYPSLFSIVKQGIPDTYPQLKKIIQNELLALKKTAEGKTISTKFYSAIERLFLQNILTDNENKTVDFASELATWGNMIIEVSRDIIKDKYSQIFVAQALKEIYASRMLYQVSRGKEGVVNMPVIVSIDEADLLVPRNKQTFCAEVITQLFTKGRKAGFSVNLITQDPTLLDNTAIKQVDWLFTTRVRDAQIAELVKNWTGADSRHIYDLFSNMDADRSRYPRQWGLLYDGTDVKLFYPPYPSAQIAREQKF